ncbi:MAG: DnaJ domain-containing protein [bacterium]|nr:DnaJ domain-containing protein [bacterium]
MAILRLLFIIAVLFYILCPLDIVPDFFIGGGWIDDIIVLIAAIVYYKRKFGEIPDLDSLFRRYQHQRKNRKEDFNRAQETTKDRKRDPYSILGVSNGDSSDEIKAAYRKLALQCHPDKVESLGKELKELAHKKMVDIQLAYEEVKKDDRR